MRILLQVDPVFNADLYWLLGAAIVLIIAYFYYRKILSDRAERKEINHDPRSHAVNDSNYNINREGIDGHRAEGMDANEANEVIDKLHETDEIPSREEFHELRKDIKK